MGIFPRAANFIKINCPAEMEFLLESQRGQWPAEAAGIPWPPHPSAGEG